MDEPKRGRPRNITPNEQKKLNNLGQSSPMDIDLNVPAWTTHLLCKQLRETYQVEYSLPGCRRLLKEADLSYQPPCRRTEATDPVDHERFDEAFNKSA